MNDPLNPYATPQSDILEAPEPYAALPLAGRWQRLGAVMLDGIVVGVIMLPAQWFAGTFQRNMIRSQEGGMFKWWKLEPENLAWSAAALLLMVAINWKFLGRGQTIGKAALDIRVANLDGTIPERKRIILLRMLPMQVVNQIPVLGMVVGLVHCLMIFRRDKRMLHDFIAGTKVVRNSNAP